MIRSEVFRGTDTIAYFASLLSACAPTARQATILLTGILIAHGDSDAQDAPWAERAIRAHVEQDNLRGALPLLVLEELRQQGEALFTAKFTTADGAGRPLATQAAGPAKRETAQASLFDRATGPDANACAGCHNQPAIGGAGDFVTNIFVAESPDADLAPMPDPSLANERGTTHIFGAGLIELLAREMTADLQEIRDVTIEKAASENREITAHLMTKGVHFGAITASPGGGLDTSRVEGIDHDLVIKPFGQKGVFVSLREFTVNVLNHHHGMQANERFGFEHTGELDFDGDGVFEEISEGDVSALVAWQAGLKPPEVSEPDDDRWKAAAARGQQVFDKMGCGDCHRPSLPLDSLKFADPGPLDAAGTLAASDVPDPAIYDLALLEWASSLPRNNKGQILVPLFGDLKRHRIANSGDPLANEKLSQRGVEPGVFMTAELWGLGSTAPYGHRNDRVTIDGIVRAHGGEAHNASSVYSAASEEDRSDLIAYLKTLAIVP